MTLLVASVEGVSMAERATAVLEAILPLPPFLHDGSAFQVFVESCATMRSIAS